MADKTSLSGFSRGDAGPGKGCGNCIFMGTGHCYNEVVNDDPEVPKVKGLVEVNPKDRCDYFESKKDVVFWVVRHGATGANEDDAYRGWRQVPLNAEGKKEAKAAGEFLKGKDITKIITSDLRRAVDTTEIIQGILDVPMEDDPRLRAWDVGAFAGKSQKTHSAAFNAYLKKPDTEIPMGESMKEFSSRVSDLFDDVTKEAKLPLLVTSSSVCLQLEKFAENKNPLGKPEQTISPGGVMAVMKNHECQEVFGKVIRPANYGS